MDEKLLKEAQDLGISPVGKTADELRAEIEERRKQTGDTKPSEPSRADTIVEELGERFLEDLNEAAKVRPRTSKEKREAREANPDFYAFQEGEMSGADRDKLQKSADAAGMSVEEYTGLSGLDRYAAKQVAPMQALAERRAKQASREIANPYDEEFVAGLSGPLGSPFELKRSLREENEKTRKEMEAWDHGGGFSLDALVRIAAHDRQGPERLSFARFTRFLGAVYNGQPRAARRWAKQSRRCARSPNVSR
jgi:hypothetical protein